MIIFDIINNIFKCWSRFKFCCFKAVVHTKWITILVKGCDSLWICGIGGYTFQMIIFDIINSLFKCWSRFKCFCFKAVVHTKWINFSSKDVIADRLKEVEVILFRWLSLILLLIVFSNVGSGSNFASSNMLFMTCSSPRRTFFLHALSF